MEIHRTCSSKAPECKEWRKRLFEAVVINGESVIALDEQENGVCPAPSTTTEGVAEVASSEEDMVELKHPDTIVDDPDEEQDDDHALGEEHTASNGMSSLEEASKTEQTNGFQPLLPEEPTLVPTKHPFATVARALQENIVAHFRRRRYEEQQEYQRLSAEEDDFVHATPNETESNQGNTKNLVSQTLAAARATVRLPHRIGKAAFAGGIAGGVAGLVVAGPAGAYAGYRAGQVAGSLGVLVEGSVTVGVFVASVATASRIGDQLHEQWQERCQVLTMGEDGTSQKVLLVRPNITIDPVWDELAQKARTSVPKPVGLLFGSSGGQKQEDSDIIKTDEGEIPTREKVLLLVSRILNDKTSLPGHVYRELINTYGERCELRGPLSLNESRTRRDDAHAVIKHVTATLLDVRPEFSVSPAMTEMTASAVESLVFGQLYELVWEEIETETREMSFELRSKALAYQQRVEGNECTGVESRPLPTSSNDSRVSIAALGDLRELSQYHTAVDKLRVCVQFLEHLSDHFSAMVCADSLLKMACQHLVLHLLEKDCDYNLHAQIRFLEEFARDQQLLQGREGYALVTLQAALHFLCSAQLEDCFQDEEQEDARVSTVSSLTANKSEEYDMVAEPDVLVEE